MVWIGAVDVRVGTLPADVSVRPTGVRPWLLQRARGSPQGPVCCRAELLLLELQPHLVSRTVAAQRSVSLTPLVTTVSAVKRFITDVPRTRRARSVYAPPAGTRQLLLLLLLAVAINLHKNKTMEKHQACTQAYTPSFIGLP